MIPSPIGNCPLSIRPPFNPLIPPELVTPLLDDQHSRRSQPRLFERLSHIHAPGECLLRVCQGEALDWSPIRFLTCLGYLEERRFDGEGLHYRTAGHL